MALAVPPTAPSRSRSDPDAVLRDPTFRQSVAFIRDVQTRFRPTPARFQEFLAAFEMLHQSPGNSSNSNSSSGGGHSSYSSSSSYYYHYTADDDFTDDDNNNKTGLPAVHDKMAALLGDQPDLLARFEAFLPHGYALRRRLEHEEAAAAAAAAAAGGRRRVRWRAHGDEEGDENDV